MTLEQLQQLTETFLEEHPGNIVSESVAIEPEVIGTRLYDTPYICVADSNDPLFMQLKEQAIGPHFMLPGEWLEDAKSVISIFLPATEQVRSSNAKDMDWPSSAWLHARIEGQNMIAQMGSYLRDCIEQSGFHCVLPFSDERMMVREGAPLSPGGEIVYTSNWSERHIAYVCGHGTFGLSKGLITHNGVAGRFISLITNAPLPVTKRDYTEVYEFCSMCGACAKNCPAGAISLEKGKDHTICNAYLSQTKTKYAPRYGCGKCQVHVPCESKPAVAFH